ncbi:MAG: 30S ribosomal protein S20 [Verrucomicrobia bacterium]|nr:MAG: 30S ribosomal protein S20 [Verrucomicrobiota bacterium]
MANTKSAAKRARQNVVRTAQNTRIISTLKTKQKNFRAAVREGKKEAIHAAMVALSSCLDKAAKRGVIHKNSADRKKSALSKSICCLGN